MNILIDIGHPAHVHLLKNTYFALREQRHQLFFTTKDIPSVKKLLDIYQIPYISLGTKSDSIKGKIINQFKYDRALRKVVKEKKINIGIGTSITLAHVSRITKMKSIILDDDDDQVQPLFVKFAHTFAHHLLSPDVLRGKRKKKNTIYYSGYHELAYLHPNYFTPDSKILSDIGVKEKESFFILRFNAFKAHHDAGVEGLSLEKKRKLIDLLKNKGKIFITTEKEIDPEFKQYQLRVSPEKIHSLLYYAAMLIGDSQTMTSEAALLGTPAIKINSFARKLSVPNEIEEKYSLCYSFLPEAFDESIGKIDQLLKISNLQLEWQKLRNRMLKDKIDVTAFLIWLVENYPESVRIMKENPEYPSRFR